MNVLAEKPGEPTDDCRQRYRASHIHLDGLKSDHFIIDGVIRPPFPVGMGWVVLLTGRGELEAKRNLEWAYILVGYIVQS